MPANLDYALYFNITFFAVIGLGFLIGYFRGLKKTLYALIVTLIFYGIFFITIDVVINQLWVLPIPFVFGYVTGFLPDLANAQTIGDAVFTMVETYAGEQLGDSLSNEVFLSFVTGLSQFVLKIVYMIVYFTLGQLIFKFIARIFRIMFFGDKDKKEINAQADLMMEQENALARKKFEDKELKKRLKKMKPKERKAYFKQQKLDKKKKKKIKVKKLSRKEKKVMAIQAKKDAKAEKKRVKKLRGKDKRAYKKEQKIYKKRKAKLISKIKRDLKKPFFGALVGGAKGAVSAFVAMILLGGMLNITESFLALVPEDTPSPTVNVEEILYLQTGYGELSMEETPDAAPLFELPPELEEQVQMGRDIVNAYNNNVFVVQASQIVYSDENYEEAVPLNLYLFDSVFSFNFSENKVLLREELSTLAETALIILDSEYMATNDLADLKGTEIAALFDSLSKSELVTSIIPLAIEVGSDYFDTPVEIPVEELYAIDWEAELSSLGAVVSVGFDLINTAGILNEETDLQTVTLDGEEVSGLFDSLADSELATLAAYVAVGPLLEQMSGDISAIITVPVDLEWDEEFRAFGQVAEAVLNTGITVGDLEAADPALLITALSDMDFTVLLSSEIVSHALKNIFSGDAGIEGLDMIVVPDGVVWFDVYDDDGNLVTPGELRNILVAVNSITTVADGFDFDNLSFDIIADFDDATIDSIFESDILVASISGFLLDMDLGDTPLLIPDSVLDLNGYILSAELKAIASSARVLVTELACDEGDTVCEEQGFDIAKAFGLTTESIDTLTTSDILGATLGNLIIDNGGEILTIPLSAMSEITVDAIAQNVVSKEEINNLFQAVSVLGFTDLDNMAFDATIIQGLGVTLDPKVLDTEKSDKLFSSKIVHATLSQMLFEQTEGVDSVLSVPYFAEDLDVIRTYDATDDLEYLSLDELEDILQALLTLDISDFTAVDSLDLNDVIAESDILLNSSILHATISKQVFDLGSDVISVPYKDVDGNSIRVSVGDSVALTDTEYIKKTEITTILDALEILGISDIGSFDGTVDLASITSEPTNIDKMLLSATLHATISDQLIKLDTDDTISVPFLEEDDETPVRRTVGDVGFETEYIVKDEIKAMIDALNVLGIVDVESFDGSVDLSLLMVDDNITVVLESSTIQATISEQLVNLDTDGTISLPYYQEDDLTLVRVTVGTLETETLYIVKSEIEAMVNAMDILGFTDIEAFTGSVDLSLLMVDDNINTVLESATIQATISDQLIGLDTDGTIKLPFFEEDGIAPVRITVGEVGFETDYILKAEITAMIEAMDVLGFTDVESFTGSVDLSLLMIDDNLTTVLNSSTIQATISDQLVELDTNGTITLPFLEEDGIVQIRVTVGDVGFETDYVLKAEITAMIEAMDVLGFTDVESFTGSVDLSLLMIDDNLTTVLNSSTIQATISEQLIGLDTDGTIVLPFFEENSITPIRTTVGTGLTETEYVLKTEITAMIDAMDILGFTDVEAFSGTVSLAPLMELDEFGTPNKDIVLLSSTIQATISKQLIDLDVAETINLPYYKENNLTKVRILVGTGATETEYVLKNEISTMIDALDILGISDVESFTGDVDLSILAVDGNAATILSSSMIQATVSVQVLDLTTDPTVTTFVVPFLEEDDLTTVRVSVGDALEFTDTEYIKAAELEAMIDGLNMLGITDVTTFDGNIDLTLFFEEANRDILLSSAIMQATISTQLIELGDATLRIPDQDITAVDVRKVVGTGITETEYITELEIGAMFEALEVLGLTDINSFNGTIDLNNVYGDTNQTAILASASMHATITKQMVDLGPAVLYIPDTDIDSTSIRQTVSGTEFLEKVEIKSMINALEVLGISDINSFTGTFNLGLLSTEVNQNTLLSSASIHATITNTLVDLDDAVLIVPTYTQVGETAGNEIRKTVSAFEFVVKGEIKALINSFTSMGYTDLNSFGASIDSTQFFTGRDTLLLSSSIQATISEKMINGTGGALTVPDIDVNDSGAIRLTHGDGIIYIEIDELNAIFDGLEELGLQDFSTMNFDLVGIFASDFNLILTSASIQATISDNILASALDENDAYSGSALVVPTLLRQAIAVNSVASEHIEKAELIQLLEGLNALGFSDFGDSLSGGTITTMTSGQLDEMFDSGSIHTTIDSMLLTNVALQIPVEAEVDLPFINDITSEVEIRYLLDALNTLGQGDFVSASFNLSAILALDAGQRSTVAESMIVRNTLQSEVYAYAILPFPIVNTPFRALVDGDYMGDDTGSFFTKVAFLEIVEHDNS